MREECRVEGCGKPAVDYIENDKSERLPLCAEHMDMAIQLERWREQAEQREENGEVDDL